MQDNFSCWDRYVCWVGTKLNRNKGTGLSNTLDVYKCKHNGVIRNCLVGVNGIPIREGVLIFSGNCTNSKSFRYVKFEDLDEW